MSSEAKAKDLSKSATGKNRGGDVKAPHGIGLDLNV